MPTKLGTENLELYKKYSRIGERVDWLTEKAKEENFYFGKQWEADEIDELKDRGQSEIVINRVRPLVRHIVSQLTANSPAFNVTGVTQHDNKKSWLFKEVINFILRENNFPKQYERACKSMIIKGLGWLWVGFDPDMDDGLGGISVKYIPLEQVYVDPVATDWEFQDASNMIVSKVIRGTLAISLWNDKKAAIKKVYGADTGKDHERNLLHHNKTDGASSRPLGVDPETTERIDETDEYVRLIERYMRTRVPVWVLDDGSGREVEVYEESKAEEMAAENKANIYKLSKMRITKITSISDVIVDTEVLPTSIYPLIPLVDEDTENPYPSGEVTFLKGIQQVINKSTSISLLNAAIVSNAKVIARKGAMSDKDLKNWVNNWANPGSVNFVDAPMDRPLTDSVLVSGGMPISPTFLDFSEMLKHEMEYEVGIFGISQGDPVDAPETYRATLALKEFGAEKIKLLIRSVDNALTTVGKVTVDFIQAYMTTQRVIRLAVDMDGNQENKQRLQDNQLLDQNGQLMINQEAEEDASEITQYLNDVTVGKYDIAVIPQSYMPTNTMARLQLYMDLLDRTVVDPESVRGLLDIKDRDKIKERLDTQNQLVGQVEALTEKLEELQGINLNLQNQTVEANMSILEERYEAKLQKILAQVQAKSSVEIQKVISELQVLKASQAPKETSNSTSSRPKKGGK